MDVLLEMSPGTGWLARENDRVLYLPNPEAVDVAHDVIEPLLVARSVRAAFDLLTGWIDSERPLPLMVLLGIDDDPQAVAHGLPALVAVTAEGISKSFPVGSAPTAIDCTSIRALTLHDEDERASGMLTEGVVRAGGFRLHLRAATPTTAVEEDAESPDGFRLRTEETSVPVGDGVILGRWPHAGTGPRSDLAPLIVTDPAVSRRHAEVRVRDGAVVVVDLDSHNGTTVVAGETGRSFRLEPEVAFPVERGDRLLVGDTVITVE